MLTVYTIEQAEKWDTIVRSFEKFDTYWLSGYVKAFQIHGDGIPLLFYFEDKEIRAINVVLKRDIAKEHHFENLLEEDKYFDFATPYGYGGWIVEGEVTDELFFEYEKWCKKHGIISEFVRFHPVIENHVGVGENYQVICLGNVVTMDLTSPEVIWANIARNNRNKIRKAQKSGIKIYHGQYPEIYEIFREIYNKTMDKDHADDYYYFNPEFYESILYDLSQYAQVFYAVLDGKIIAASIMLGANGKINYHLSGSLKEYQHLAPTNLLLYETALWGYANGYKTLYLGGGVGSAEDSLYEFKKSFYRKEDLKHFNIGKKILNEEMYKKLVDMRAKDKPECRSLTFFPQYRA